MKLLRLALLTSPGLALVPGAAWALGPQPPDQVDVFYQIGVKPQVELLLDTSSSMNGSSAVSVCPWYQTSGPLAPVSAGGMNKKHHQLRASLLGCNSADDGILDKWSSKVSFAIRGFSGGSTLLAPFGTGHAGLEAAIVGFGLSGGTSMTLGLRQAGADFQGFDDSNSLSCRPNIVLLLSDGNPNTAGGTFDYECDAPSPPDSLTYGAGEPWCGAGYLAGSTAPASGAPIVCTPALTTPYQDMVCGVTGNQPIETYTIGFGRSGSFSPTNLQRIATLGKGQYFFASNVSALDNAFDTIINAMADRAIVTYAPPAISLDGVFAGNRAYTASFKPSSDGFWTGNVKSSCVLPNVSPTGNFDATATCYYVRDGSNPKKVVGNAAAVDLYSGTNAADAAVGGVGQLLRNRLATTPAGATPRAPLFPRTILTWKPGSSALIAASAANLGPDDLFTHGIERIKTINRLHGYTYDADLTDGGPNDDDVTGLDPDDTDPLAVAAWPLGEALNSKLQLVTYGGGTQYILMAANDGMLHAFNAATGQETSALLVGEALAPNNAANFSVKDAMGVVNEDVRHPYLLDGQLRLYHEDLDADLRIDPAERASLIVGLGRAGAGYYLIDMGSFSGTFTTAANRVFPLLRTPGTHFEDLADTWAAPWVGKMKVGGATRRVAIFGSGHERGFDDPAAAIPSSLPGEYVVSAPINVPCSTLVATSSLAGAYCNFMFPGVGYPDVVPNDVVLGPIELPNAVAYRVRFGTFAVDPNDELRLQGGEGSTAAILRGGLPIGHVSEWVYDDQLAINLITDGVQTLDPGFVLDSVDYRVATAGPPRRRSPSIYVVDLDRWNGPAPGPAPAQAFTSATDDRGMLLRFTADCGGSDLGSRCFDGSLGGAYADLANMRCPISAEVSVLEVGGRAERAYVGDECGQIWRLSMDPATGSWAVERIFNANSDVALPGGWPAIGAAPVRDVRKIQRRIDLVRSRCSGKTSIGLYFGTGNLQRPTATDELPGRGDIAGVIWDDGTLGSGTGIANLDDVSTTNSISPPAVVASGKKGWFFTLRANERMLRDPLVFARTAYFKTFRPTTAATECSPGSGEDAIYSVDSCSAEAYNDSNGNGVKTFDERLAQVAGGDIGASPSILATRDTVVVLGDNGQLNQRFNADYRRARMLNWRITK